MLIGINLLREGLDIPEVSLVAILDADKEGFLRSEVSMIQTMGRAARNVKGKAILYADKITGSMQRAMDETSRRREKQQAHNEKQGITPKGVVKKITDIMESNKRDEREFIKEVAEEKAKYQAFSAADIAKVIKKLEAKMYQHSRDLEFEEAARVRDEVNRLNDLAVLGGE